MDIEFISSIVVLLVILFGSLGTFVWLKVSKTIKQKTKEAIYPYLYLLILLSCLFLLPVILGMGWGNR